jgi:Mrp family chromosome partitioning ATPase
MSTIERALARVAQKGKRARNGGGNTASTLPPAPSFSGLTQVRLDPQHLEHNRLVVDESAPAHAAYKMLRTRVLQRMRRNNWTTLAVTGISQGEGKTTTAINLALSLARDVTTSVILVDLDLRKPAIHHKLGLKPGYAFTDYLGDSVPLERTLVCPGPERLAVLLNAVPYTNSSEIVTSPQMGDLVHRLKDGRGRIVVFDLPPLLVTDDLLAFSPFVDAVLLVVSQGITKRDDLLAAKEMLGDINVVGTILNRSTEDIGQYYSYYGYS